MLNAFKIQDDNIESGSKSCLIRSVFGNNERQETDKNGLETDCDGGGAKALLNHKNVESVFYKLQSHESATNTVMQNMQETPKLDDAFKISESPDEVFVNVEDTNYDKHCINELKILKTATNENGLKVVKNDKLKSPFDFDEDDTNTIIDS